MAPKKHTATSRGFNSYYMAASGQHSKGVKVCDLLYWIINTLKENSGTNHSTFTVYNTDVIVGVSHEVIGFSQKSILCAQKVLDSISFQRYVMLFVLHKF